MQLDSALDTKMKYNKTKAKREREREPEVEGPRMRDEMNGKKERQYFTRSHSFMHSGGKTT